MKSGMPAPNGHAACRRGYFFGGVQVFPDMPPMPDIPLIPDIPAMPR